MKITYQRGTVGNFILGIIISVLLVGWLLARNPAEPAAVQAVIASAKGNVAATKAVTTALERTPTPTVSELNDIRRQVDEILVLDTSREVTGNPSLKSTAAIKAEQDARSQAATDRLVKDRRFSWPFYIFLFCAGLFFVLNGYNRFKQRDRL